MQNLHLTFDYSTYSRGVFRTFELRVLTIIDCPNIAGANTVTVRNDCPNIAGAQAPTAPVLNTPLYSQK